MKPVLIRQTHQRAGDGMHGDNELLRLATELLEQDGHFPRINVAGATIAHWNGRQISVASSDIVELMDRYLIAPEGDWSEYGRALLSFAAGKYEEAGDWAGKARGGGAPQDMILAILAAALFRLGRWVEARDAVSVLMAHGSQMSCARFRRSMLGAPAVMESLADALAGAGLPDEDAAPPRVGPVST